MRLDWRCYYLLLACYYPFHLPRLTLGSFVLFLSSLFLSDSVYWSLYVVFLQRLLFSISLPRPFSSDVALRAFILFFPGRVENGGKRKRMKRNTQTFEKSNASVMHIHTHMRICAFALILAYVSTCSIGKPCWREVKVCESPFAKGTVIRQWREQ